jgi:hypothetical protein
VECLCEGVYIRPDKQLLISVNQHKWQDMDRCEGIERDCIEKDASKRSKMGLVS